MSTIDSVAGKQPIADVKDAMSDGEAEAGNSSVANTVYVDTNNRKLPFSIRVLRVLWDTLDKTPEERAFIAKIDWWIFSYACIA